MNAYFCEDYSVIMQSIQNMHMLQIVVFAFILLAKKRIAEFVIICDNCFTKNINVRNKVLGITKKKHGFRPCFSIRLTALSIVIIKPFAYIVNYYTCFDGQHKRDKHFHGITSFQVEPVIANRSVYSRNIIP
jgi:hypothetical protein